MDSSESNHTPRSRTVSQLRTTDDPTGSDRYAAGILDSVVRLPKQTEPLLRFFGWEAVADEAP